MYFYKIFSSLHSEDVETDHGVRVSDALQLLTIHSHDILPALEAQVGLTFFIFDIFSLPHSSSDIKAYLVNSVGSWAEANSWKGLHGGFVY